MREIFLIFKINITSICLDKTPLTLFSFVSQTSPPLSTPCLFIFVSSAKLSLSLFDLSTPSHIAWFLFLRPPLS